jgi:hypothetical protein
LRRAHGLIRLADGVHFDFVDWSRWEASPIRIEERFAMVAQAGEGPILLIKKLVGLILIVLGCLLIATGFNWGTTVQIVFGVLLLAAGVTLLVLKIARRNQSAELR